MKPDKASWAPSLNIIIIIIFINCCSHKTDHDFASHCHFRDILTSELGFQVGFRVRIRGAFSSCIELGFDLET